MEEWKDIKGYEGLYQISNKGRVKSLGNNKTRKEKILKENKNTDGYSEVTLCKNGKCKKYRVHRLVAEAFIPTSDKSLCVNHKDENKSNNCVENLEWCDRLYNNNYGTRNERLSRKIICIETNEVFMGAKDAIDKMFGGKGRPSNITNQLKGRSKSAFKYHFKYIDE